MNSNLGKPYAKEFCSGDIIKIEVNTKYKTIKYNINDKDFGIACNNINFENNTKYNFVVSMYEKDDCVELVDFKITNIEWYTCHCCICYKVQG